MISKKYGLLISGLGILSFLFSIIYVSSCTRPIPDNPWACNYVYCQNGGKCDSAHCKCPIGYEGTDCSVATVDKFIGFWQMDAHTVGSDSANLIGTHKKYVIELQASATNTTFFMHNLDDNPNYHHIICKIDSNDKDVFTFDTTSVLNMYYDHYRIRGGWGIIYNDKKDSISGMLFVRHLNATVNWQIDTIVLTAKKL